ncbi:hypothetical protein IID22_03460 [Patescibacteria group bacterium]|nr:hypothetical protein [Patescibacteria group bacterium]
MSETSEIPDTIEAVKPKVLYHASDNRNIEVMEPRKESIRDPKEGPVVFADPDKAAVTKFIVPYNDKWTKKGRFGDVHYHVIQGRERYEELDTGGTIYHLNPETFEHNLEFGGSGDEWTSKVAVKPIGRDDYASGLQAQLDNGIQVFFVDDETFERIDKSDDHGNEIIRGLKSENELKNINPKEIPPFRR